MIYFLYWLLGAICGMLFTLFLIWRETNNNVGGSHYKAIFKDKNIDEVI